MNDLWTKTVPEDANFLRILLNEDVQSDVTAKLCPITLYKVSSHLHLVI